MTARKYDLVADHLRQLLLSGNPGPGGRLPSFAALRRTLGVTQATIDSALAQLERDALIVRRPGSGIFASGARSLAADGVLILSGFPLDLPTDYQRGGWGSAVFFGALARCQRQGYRITLLDPHRITRAEVERLVGLQPGGILLLPAEDRALGPHVADLCRQPVPKLAWDCATPPTDDFLQLEHDHAGGARLLTDWLIARGHRRILQVAPRGAGPWMAARRRGHLAALERAGIAPLPLVELTAVQPGEPFIEKARAACGRIAEHLIGPGATADAIMAPSDGEVFQLARASRMCGREPDRDLALVGYDDYWRSASDRAHEPSVRPRATIDKGNLEIGQRLVSLLEGLRPGGEHAALDPTPAVLVVTERQGDVTGDQPG